MDRLQRITIGVAAVAALAVGGYGIAVSLDPSWPPIVLRSGIILAALWFAAPAFKTASRREWIGVSVVAAVVAIRPRLILWGLAAALIAAIVFGRSAARRSQDTSQ